jgi:flavin-dependent dehydrogenase
VRRSAFDEILFRNAQRKGAHALEGCKVTAVEFTAEGATVSARLEDGAERSWQTRFVVDASGRDTFLASRMGIKRRNKKHNSAALYGHFTGAKRLPGKAEGNITVFWFEHGWFWFIPLSDGATSVGAVCWPYYLKTRETSTEQFLLDTIKLCPALAERLRDAQLASPVTATGNYSYVAKRSMGRNYVMLGDAYTFIDPVFSTGVLLAMQSAFAGADTIETCLDHPRAARAALRRFDARMRRGPGIFSWLIYRVTTPAIRELFMAPSERFGLQAALVSVLAGDIFGRTRWRAGLAIFQAIYYIKSLFMLRQSVAAWFRRRRSIQSA